MEKLGGILLAFFIFPGLLFTGVFGLIVTWIDRKLSARLQWRVGAAVKRLDFYSHR